MFTKSSERFRLYLGTMSLITSKLYRNAYIRYQSERFPIRFEWLSLFLCIVYFRYIKGVTLTYFLDNICVSILRVVF